jgi:hypothetical protein
VRFCLESGSALTLKDEVFCVPCEGRRAKGILRHVGFGLNISPTIVVLACMISYVFVKKRRSFEPCRFSYGQTIDNTERLRVKSCRVFLLLWPKHLFISATGRRWTYEDKGTWDSFSFSEALCDIPVLLRGITGLFEELSGHIFRLGLYDSKLLCHERNAMWNNFTKRASWFVGKRIRYTKKAAITLLRNKLS